MQPFLTDTTGLARKGFVDARAGADAFTKSMGNAVRGSQSIGIEWLDYLKQVGTEAAAAAEKVATARSPAKAIEAQSAYVKASGELFTARAATFRDLYAALARDVTKPFAALAERKAA